MIIKKLFLDNFGKFENFALDLPPEFTVVYGQNEEGKSTVMAFILMMFYGHSGRSKEITSNPRRKYRPWNGREMKGRILFSAQGTNYRLERTFGQSNTTDEVTIWNEDTGEKIKTSSKKDPGVEFFGMSGEAFAKSVFIGQGGTILDAGGDGEEITQRLLNLVTTGNEDLSYKQAVDHLQSLEDSLVSRNRKSGLLTKSRETLEALRREKSQAESDEADKLSYGRALQELQAKRGALIEEKAGLQQAKDRCLLVKKLEDWQAAMSRANQLADFHRQLQEITGDLTGTGGVIDGRFAEDTEAMLKIHERVLEQIEAMDLELAALQTGLSALKAAPPPEVSETLIQKLRLDVLTLTQQGDRIEELKAEITEGETYINQAAEAERLESRLKEAADKYRLADEWVHEMESSCEIQAAEFNRLNHLREKCQGTQRELELQVTRLQAELDNHTERLEAARADVAEKITYWEARLREAETPEVLEEEIPGTWGLKKPLLALAVLTMGLFIPLGIYLHRGYYGGLVLSVLLLLLSITRPQNQKVTRTKINQALIDENRAKLEESQSNGEIRIHGAEAAAQEAAEAIRRLQAELETVRSNLSEIEPDYSQADQVLGVMVRQLDEAKLMRIKSQSLQEAVDDQYRQAQELLRKTKEPISGNDLETKKAELKALQEGFNNLREAHQAELRALGGDSLEAVTDHYVNFTRHQEKTAAKAREIETIREKREKLLLELNAAKTAILEQVGKYQTVHTVQAAEAVLQAIKDRLKLAEGLKTQLAYGEEHRQGIERTHSLEDMAAVIRVTQTNLETLSGQADTVGQEFTDLPAIEMAMEQVTREIGQIGEKIASLESEVREKYRSRRNISQVNDAMEEVKELIDLQTEDYEALKIARQTMTEAFDELQKSFGPMLNKQTAEIFNTLTKGKYQEVRVGRDFGITFEDREGKNLHEWGFLSSGTIDQAYLSLRLAIADLITRDGDQLPILLDDVFIQYDDIRAHEGLQFINNYIRKKDHPIQAVLFTCHQRIRDWAGDIPGITVLHLSALG